MNDEKSASIREVRNTLNQINMEIPSHPLGSHSRNMLEQTAVVLETLIWKIVHKDLKEISGELKQHQSRLSDLVQEMEEAHSSLEKIKAMVEKVANLIGTLANLA